MHSNGLHHPPCLPPSPHCSKEKEKEKCAHVLPLQNNQGTWLNVVDAGIMINCLL